MGGSVSVSAGPPVTAVTESGVKLLEMVNSLELKESAKTEAHEQVLRNLLIVLQTEEVLEAHNQYDETFLDLQGSSETAGALAELDRILQQYDGATPLQGRDGASLSSLLDKAAEVRPLLETLVNEIREQCGSVQTLETAVSVVAPVKAATRAEEKAAKDYGGDVRRLLDLARASLVLSAIPSAIKVISIIQALCEAQHHRVVRIKSDLSPVKAASTLPGGYFDIKVNVDISGHICEIQLHIEDFYHHKGEMGYLCYKWARDRDITSASKPLDLVPAAERSPVVLEQMVGFLEACTLPERDGVLDGLYGELGMYPQLLCIREEALRSNERVFGESHLKTLASLSRLALVNLKLGNSEAQKTLATVVEGYKQALGPRHPKTLASILTLAEELLLAGEDESAQPLLQQLIVDYSEVLGKDHSETLTAKAALARSMEHSGKLEAAEQAYRDVLSFYIQTKGERSSEVADVSVRLGKVLFGQTKLDEASEKFQAALNIQRELQQHKAAIRSTAILLVKTLEALHRVDEVIELYRTIAGDLRSEIGDKHPETISLLDSYASFLQKVERYDDAEAILREVVTARKEVYGERNIAYLKSLQDLGRLLNRIGKKDDARLVLADAMKGREEVFGVDDPSTMSVREDLAGL